MTKGYVYGQNAFYIPQPWILNLCQQGNPPLVQPQSYVSLGDPHRSTDLARYPPRGIRPRPPLPFLLHETGGGGAPFHFLHQGPCQPRYATGSTLYRFVSSFDKNLLVPCPGFRRASAYEEIHLPFVFFLSVSNLSLDTYNGRKWRGRGGNRFSFLSNFLPLKTKNIGWRLSGARFAQSKFSRSHCDFAIQCNSWKMIHPRFWMCTEFLHLP